MITGRHTYLGHPVNVQSGLQANRIHRDDEASPSRALDESKVSEAIRPGRQGERRMSMTSSRRQLLQDYFLAT